MLIQSSLQEIKCQGLGLLTELNYLLIKRFRTVTSVQRIKINENNIEDRRSVPKVCIIFFSLPHVPSLQLSTVTLSPSDPALPWASLSYLAPTPSRPGGARGALLPVASTMIIIIVTSSNYILQNIQVPKQMKRMEVQINRKYKQQYNNTQ
ncbi:Hypothetical_protein [Hexamita inflata]|uniref:Hypothetical_protein n=1 Tax=Hexamita inflata TaxID=28002 RepID=A0ABP1HVZ7_9EUKA